MKKSLLIFAPAMLASVASQAQRYNVVYIMTDDHTAQMMSCYDNRFVSTPNLDRIAADGVKFVNSFVANSLSGPSRACMITGKHSHKNGFTNNEHGILMVRSKPCLSLCKRLVTKLPLSVSGTW